MVRLINRDPVVSPGAATTAAAKPAPVPLAPVAGQASTQPTSRISRLISGQ